MTVRAGTNDWTKKKHWYNLPINQLVNLLHQDASLVDIQARLIADEKLTGCNA